MNHYVVDTYNEAIRAINLLSKAAQGRAQFFVLDGYEMAAPTDPIAIGSPPPMGGRVTCFTRLKSPPCRAGSG